MTSLPQARARLLLVDDDDALRRSIARWLEAHLPVRVTAVATGERALELVRAGERFHGAVLDWEMPGIDGIELMTRLRELVPGMPCGIWSASERLRGVDARAASFALLKGDPRQLGQAVEGMLARTRGRRRARATPATEGRASEAAAESTPHQRRPPRSSERQTASKRTPRSSEVRRRIDSTPSGDHEGVFDDSGTEDL